MAEPTSTAMQEPDDATLLARCAAGDERAWEALVRRYQRLVYTVPRRAGLSSDEAADVFQFTFSRLFERLDGLSQPDRLSAWLVTTARRETLRLLELSRRHVRPAASAANDSQDDPMARLPDPDPLPPERLEALQLQDRMWRAVKRLDTRSRAMIELLFLQPEPLPYSEIAARLGISEGSIGPTRARCLEKLRVAMEREA